MNAKRLNQPFSSNSAALRIAPVLALLGSVLSMTVLGGQQGNFFYEIIGNDAELTGYRGPGGDEVIPDLLGGQPVTRISGQGFRGVTTLRSVFVPKSVTSIVFWAFQGCTGLTAIEVAPFNPVYRAMDGIVFSQAKSELLICPPGKVGSYSIPDTVTAIGDFGFYGCVGLTNVTIPSTVTSIGDYGFDGCGLTSMTIPESVRNIGTRAFANCAGMTNVVLPDSVTSIGSFAFEGCTNLTSIALPNSLGSIAAGTFKGCTGLTSITIPDSVASIGFGSFAECTGLTELNLGKSLTSIENGAHGHWLLPQRPGAFEGCTSLSRVIFPDSVTEIGAYAFYHCTNMTNASLGKNARTIMENAFGDCPRMIGYEVSPLSTGYSSSDSILFDKARSVLVLWPQGKGGSYSIPNGVSHIRESAFSGSTALAHVTIPGSVRTIRRNAFAGCRGLTSINIPDGVVSLGYGAFSGCTGLTNIDLGNSLKEIENGSFSDKYSSYEPGAFSGCTELTSVALPKSLTYLGALAFRWCTRLATVTIPKDLTNIAHSAFFECPNLTRLEFEGNARPAPQSVYYDASPFVTVFHRPQATGWGPTFAGRPTAVWTSLPEYEDWQSSIGLVTEFPAASGEGDDPDSDGFTNDEERVAGTDPSRSDSALAIELVPRFADLADADRTPIPAAKYAMYFHSVAGRYYGLQRATSLGGSWALQAVRIAAQRTTQTRLVLDKPRPNSQAFYRVVVLP